MKTLLDFLFRILTFGQTEIRKLKKLMSGYEHDISTHLLKIASLQALLDEKESIANSLNTMIGRKDSEIKALSNRLDISKTNLDKNVKFLKSKENLIAKLKADNKALNKALGTLPEELEDALNKVDGLNRKIEECEDDSDTIEDLNSKISDQNTKLEKLKLMLEDKGCQKKKILNELF